jgi:hypothetical protein
MFGNLLEAYSYIYVLAHLMNQEVLRDENKGRLRFSFTLVGRTLPTLLVDWKHPSYLIMADLDALWTCFFPPTSMVRSRLYNDVSGKALHQRFRQAISPPIRTSSQ